MSVHVNTHDVNNFLRKILAYILYHIEINIAVAGKYNQSYCRINVCYMFLLYWPSGI